MSTKKDNWFKRNYLYLRNTITPMDPEDSKYERFKKNMEFGFFAILLSCGTLAIVLAASFAH